MSELQEVSKLSDIKLYTKAGQNVYTIDISSLDYFYLIEDIFSFCMTGKISFFDHIGVWEFGPITGDETLEFTFGHNNDGQEETRKIRMKIYKINKLEPTVGIDIIKRTAVEFTLVDEYYYKFHKKNWSKSWKDEPVHNIIRDICNNHLDITEFDEFENTNEKIPFFDTHLKSPAESILWLMNRASGSDTGSPGFLFFHRGNTSDIENTSFNFVTLEKLLQQKQLMKPSSGEDEPYAFMNTNMSYYNKIVDFEINAIDFNALRSISGATLLGFDTKRKKFLRMEYDYKKALNMFTVLGSKTLFSTDMIIDKTEQIIETVDNEVFLDNLWYGNWIKEYCNQNIVSFIVDGNLERYAGGMIKVEWPSNDSDGAEVYNKQLNGRYLVSKVIHYFDIKTKPVYTQKLVCIKNGYDDSNNNSLVSASKINL